ncbi:MAG: hypothetical protein HFH41_03860 [Lachnospiraceae bacterium]|nr:hypothetical protein [Lachnospiraceae bacterium]
MTKDEYILMVTNSISSLKYSHVEKYTMTMILKMLVKTDKKNTTYSESDFNDSFLESLHTDSVNDSKNLRKLLSLPITKELRYMKKENNSFSSYKIKSYQIVDWYTESDSASLKLTLENEQSIRILSDYFSHMQKASFEKDIHEQEKDIE